MTHTDIQAWVEPVRRRIATGRAGHLDDAIRNCDDPALRDVLTQFAEDSWQEAVTSSLPLVGQYLRAGREAESAVIYLLGLDCTLEHLPACDPDVISGSEIGIDFSRRVRFLECEGKFLLTLGICSLRNHQPDKAEVLLVDSASRFGSAMEDASTYDFEKANALVNLGAARQLQHKYDLAEKSLREAVTLVEARAETEGRFKGILSAAVSSLATVLLAQEKSDEALEAYAQAIRLMKALIPEYPGLETHLAETLTNFGSLHFDLGRYEAAVEVHEDAIERFRRLCEHDAGGHGHQLVVALINSSNAYQELRLFASARRVLEEALDICRAIPLAASGHGSVAGILMNIGSLQFEEEDWDAAQASFEEAVAILRETEDPAPIERDADLSSALNNLGMVHRSREELAEAETALDEAIHLRRGLTGTGRGKRNLAESLQNRSTILRDLGEIEAAAEGLIEARNLILETASGAPDRTLAQLISVMNNLVVVHEDLDQEDAALEVARETVRRLETAGVQKDVLWLLKGKAESAYGRIMLANLAKGANDEVLRCFATLRNPSALLSRPSKETEPGAISAELRLLADRLGEPVKIICAQVVTERTSVLATIGVDGIESAQSVDEFHAAAAELFEQMTTVFDPHDRRDPTERNEAIRQLAEDAWGHLPADIRAALSPESGGEVLMSGDSTWTRFPWEGLRYGADPQSWMGLQRALPRLHGLSASVLSGLRDRRLPSHDRAGAAVIAPWNVGVDTTRHLHRARDEAENVAKRWSEVGFELLPHGRALIGAAAHAAAFEEILARDYAILHFSGHGGVVRNEEVLLLPSRVDPGELRFFGRQQIIGSRMIGATVAADAVGGALVVLNACFIGQTHSFGGRREDLVSAFLESGAEAVVASALPIFDEVGQMLGETLYDKSIADTTLGSRLVQTRRLIEAATRGSAEWPGWAFLSCHGNPFARMAWLEATSDSES